MCIFMTESHAMHTIVSNNEQWVKLSVTKRPIISYAVLI